MKNKKQNLWKRKKNNETIIKFYALAINAIPEREEDFYGIVEKNTTLTLKDSSNFCERLSEERKFYVPILNRIKIIQSMYEIPEERSADFFDLAEEMLCAYSNEEIAVPERKLKVLVALRNAIDQFRSYRVICEVRTLYSYKSSEDIKKLTDEIDRIKEIIRNQDKLDDSHSQEDTVD